MPDPQLPTDPRAELQARADAGNTTASEGMLVLDAAGALVAQTAAAVSEAMSVVATVTNTPAPAPERPSAAAVAARRPQQAEPKIEARETDKVALVASGAEVPMVDAQEYLYRTASNQGQPRTAGRDYVYARPIEGLKKMGEDPDENAATAAEAFASTQAARQAETPALVAASWCAPPDPLYSFVSVSSGSAGVIQLPEVLATRGRVVLTPAPTVLAISAQNGVGELWDGVSTKTPYSVTCETSVTFETEATYTSIEFSNTEILGYPERVSAINSEALKAHQQAVSAFLISEITTASEPYGAIGTGGGALVSVARNLTMFSDWMRQRYAADPNTVIDCLAPFWLRSVLESDLITRASSYDPGLVGLNGWVARLRKIANVDLQFVYSLDADLSSAAPPGSVGLYLFFAGSVIRLRGKEISTGLFTDSTLAAANKQALFHETFDGVAFQGPEVVNIQAVDICANGETGQAVDVGCEVS